MKSDDYVKYLTEQFVHYMNQPRDFRKQVRAEKKQSKISVKYQLFGLLPDAFSHTFGRLRHSTKIKTHSLPFLTSQKRNEKK